MRAIDALEPTLRPAPSQRDVHEWYAVPLLQALLLLALAGWLQGRLGRRSVS